MYLGCHQIRNTDAIVVIDRTMISSSNHAKCCVWAIGFSYQTNVDIEHFRIINSLLCFINNDILVSFAPVLKPKLQFQICFVPY